MAFFELPEAPFPAPFDTPGRPVVPVDVEIRGERGQIVFRIDTGADLTSISAADAHELFGEPYLEPDFASGRARVATIGVGGSAAHFVEYADLWIVTDDDLKLALHLPILIAESDPNEPVHFWEHREGAQRTPSLLGLDVLRYFEFRLRYGDDPAVMLLA